MTTDIEREAIGRANKFRECVKCGKAWNCRHDGEPCPACEAPAAPPIQPVIETAGELSLHIRKYQVGDSRVTVEWRGTAMWAVCEGGCCLAEDGEWEAESMPSNRTDDFIARCRFSLPEATRRAIGYVAALNPASPQDGKGANNEA